MTGDSFPHLLQGSSSSCRKRKQLASLKATYVQLHEIGSGLLEMCHRAVKIRKDLTVSLCEQYKASGAAEGCSRNVDVVHNGCQSASDIKAVRPNLEKAITREKVDTLNKKIRNVLDSAQSERC